MSSRNEILKKSLQGNVSPSLDYEESLFMSQVRSPEPEPASYFSCPGIVDFCFLHRLLCQRNPSFSLKSTLLCLLFSDVSDKERHEDSPGQAPHPDGEWT